MTSLTASVRVLLVEDNSADLALVQSCLKDYGQTQIDMTAVTRLADAVTALKQQSFHVVITDLNLPDTEGLQTFIKLKEASPESAFVVMSGIDDRDTCLQAVRAGAQDYLVKGDSSPRRIWQSVRNAIVRQSILLKVETSAKDLGDMNTRLQELARVDPLTGLYNRRGFDERVAHEASRPQFRSSFNSVLLVDVDNFKQVNDQRGHDQGDLALLEVSKRLRAGLRPGDIAGRVGGDEFMVLLPDTKLEMATEVAERIRRSVDESPVPSDAGSFHLTVSVGVARQTGTEGTAHNLLARTHQALAMSKQRGKNQVSYEGSIIDLSGDPSGAVRILRRPFFRMADGKVMGYEFLCRSHPSDPADGPAKAGTPPHALQAFHYCLQASAQLPQGLALHVRLHCDDLQGLDAKALLSLIPKKFDPALLGVEIRDLSHMASESTVPALLRTLLGEGIHPVLHDTDLMQNTMAALIQLEPHWVKLGHGWFSGVSSDPFKEGHLRRLLKIVDSLGAQVIACGVENREDLEALRQLNVFHGQGSLWSGHS